MENRAPECRISEEDLRAALKEMRSYVDITEEDLKKIYEIALRHARGRAALRIPVREVMTKQVVTIAPRADVHEAAQVLSERAISGMPVVDDQNRVVGVISEADLLMLAGMDPGHTFRDILHRILGEPAPAGKKGDKVEQVMSMPAITARPEDEVTDVARILDVRRIKRLPVVDQEGKLVGIISRADIVRAVGTK
jgi:CBS-domain-containing membrane protein